MYYSYDYSTIPPDPQYWVKPCWECGEDYHPNNPHNHSEQLPEDPPDEPDENLIPEGDVQPPEEDDHDGR